MTPRSGRSRLAASGGGSLPVRHGPEHVDLPRGGHADVDDQWA